VDSKQARKLKPAHLARAEWKKQHPPTKEDREIHLRNSRRRKEINRLKRKKF
jgi:hypothetical protein